MQKTGRRFKAFQEWDVKQKIPALFLLMMSMSFVRNDNLMFLLPCISAILFISSGIPISILLSKLRVPLVFLLSVSLFLILFSTGINTAINTCVRVLSIITIGVVMVETTPLAGISGKLKELKIPKILVDIGILTGRYIMVTAEDFKKMRNSRRLRGHVNKKGITSQLKIIVPTSATLLIRGFQQSEIVFNAMHMRGYGAFSESTAKQQIKKPSQPKLNMILLLLALIFSLTLIVLEISIEY